MHVDLTTHLFTVLVGAAAGPEEVRTDADGSALVGLLQQLGGGQCTLGPQRLVVFFAETTHALKGANNQRDGCQLSFGVTYLVLVQGKGLGKTRQTDIYNIVKIKEKQFPSSKSP